MQKQIPTMVIMLITMCATGLVMGAIFPYFAELFVNTKVGLGFWFSLSCLAAGLMIGISNYLIARTILYKPMRQLHEHVALLAEGNLSAKITVYGNDIVGQLAQGINRVTDHFSKLVKDTRLAIERVECITENLRTFTQKSSNSSHQSLAVSHQQIANSAEQFSTVEQINQTMTDMSTQVAEASSLINSATAAAIQFSATASEGYRLVEELSKGMNHMQGEVGQAEYMVIQLETHSERITGIVQLIHELSSQTNLLALNASIEAARAGEYGRGFAVVAEEVKKLSQDSTSAAQQIGELIVTIQEKVKEAVRSTKESVATIQAEESIMLEARSVFSQVEATSKVLGDSMKHADAELQKTTHGSGSVLKAMDVLGGLSSINSKLSEEVGGMIQSQVTEIQRIESEADALNDAVNLLAETLEKINVSATV